MKSLKRILIRYLPPVFQGTGGFSSDNAPKEGIDRARLRGELSQIVKRNQLYFNLVIALPLILFVALLFVVSQRLDRHDLIQSLSVATGVSFMGVLAVATRLWKAKLTAEIIIALAGSLPQDALSGVVVTLIAKM